MEITKEEVLKIAHMSRITLNVDEIDEIEHHLRDVINYARRVIGVADKGEQSFYTNTNIFRPDQALKTDPQPLLDLAPQSESDYYVVPAVIEQE